MQLEFIGAAQTVTGSKHLIRTKHATVLLDCGFFQGRRKESNERNQNLGVNPSELDAVVLSHAHIDHSGALPLLVKQGYDGPIFMTPATRDLCAAMLEDTAMIQRSDAAYINRAIERDRLAMDPVTPLYDSNDVARMLAQTFSVPYRKRHTIAKGVTLTFFDAGHVLGSAISALDIEEDGKTKRLIFTGDLGRKDIPILKDPEVPPGGHILITESTYGNRLHKPIEAMSDELANVITRTYQRGGKVVIPSFALERAQEIVFSIKALRKQGRIPKLPVYVDSPLTVKVTDVFKLHPECYDDETRDLITGHDSPFDFDELVYVSDKEESKAIDASTDPCIVISASGMCEAGRIVHHLKATIEDPKNTVAIVGFQAQHTLGRRIVERRPRVRIFGVERELRAEVATLNGFSAHADQRDLISFANEIREAGSLEHVLLVHGEVDAQSVLRQKLLESGIAKVSVPNSGETFEA